MITTNRDGQTTASTISPSAEVAAAQMVDQALDFAAKRLRDEDEALIALRAGSAEAHDYFRYGLALRVGEWLATAGGPAEGIYLNTMGAEADEVEDEAPMPTSPLHLIVWVRQKTAALEALAEQLDAAITARYRQLLAPRVDELRSLLDVQIVDDADVEQRRASGAVLTALHARPQQVWPRDAA